MRVLFTLLVFLSFCNPTKKEERPVWEPFLLFGLVSYASTSPFDAFAERDVDFPRFLGTWNEIQRIDNSFQRGLTKSSATYTDNGNGQIGVLNQGIRADGGITAQNGVALVPDPKVGRLKVSFAFPFFFGDFIILRIDRLNYQTALIGGPTPNFLWVFSRQETINPTVESNYINYAKEIGYNVESLNRFR